MPITPFHFGPGALVHALAPRQLSFLAFCGANVVMDVEPLYFMLTGQFQLHRFCHSYVGAALVLLVTVALFWLALRLAAAFGLPNPLGWQQLTMRQVAAGAALGSYSHIVFDSIMHSDMRPLAPFSDANALLGLISLEVLHWTCLGAGVAGLAILGLRQRKRSD